MLAFLSPVSWRFFPRPSVAQQGWGWAQGVLCGVLWVLLRACRVLCRAHGVLWVLCQAHGVLWVLCQDCSAVLLFFSVRLRCSALGAQYDAWGSCALWGGDGGLLEFA